MAKRNSKAESDAAAQRLLLSVVYANHADIDEAFEDKTTFYDGWQNGNILLDGVEISIGSVFRAANRLLVDAYREMGKAARKNPARLVHERLIKLAQEETTK